MFQNCLNWKLAERVLEQETEQYVEAEKETCMLKQWMLRM